MMVMMTKAKVGMQNCKIINNSYLHYWTLETVQQMTNQQRFKPLCSKRPVQAQVVGEQGSNSLAATTTHPACLLQLSHIGIYKWHSSLSLCKKDDMSKAHTSRFLCICDIMK